MANRYSPTVRPDDTTDRRPGLEVADAFKQMRNQNIEDDLLQEDQLDRDRRRGREDIVDAGAELEFEQWLKDNLGATPTEPGGTPAGPPASESFDPTASAPLFEEARIGMQAGTAPGARSPLAMGGEEELGEVAVLPGQFMGGQFSQELVRTPTRTIAGREFAIDPTQTAEARGKAQEAEQRRRKIAALVGGGIPQQEAVAMVDAAPGAIDSHFERRDPSEARRNDPMKGEFTDDAERDAFLGYRRRLAIADAAGRTGTNGRTPGDGPIDVQDALAELDQMYGEFDRSGNLVGHRLSERERFDLATRWSEGRLSPNDLPEQEEGPAPADTPEEPGFFKKILNRLNPSVDAMGNPTPPAPSGERNAGGSSSPAPGPSGDAAVDSIRSIAREYSGKVAPARIREIFLERGYTPEQVDAALGG